MSGRGIAYLDSLVGWDGGGYFDLTRPLALMSRLGNPQDKIPAVHVAGTNGKGTVTALLAAMFFCSGKRVAQFSSPHLSSVTERCVINGLPISLEEFERAIDRAAAAADDADCRPSYFEMATAACFDAAVAAGAELLAVEVGLGGELDATNVISSPLVSVITTIGSDHTNVLGESIEQIAAAKAGIIKPGSPVVCGNLPPAALKVVESTAAGVGAGRVVRWGVDYLPVGRPGGPLEAISIDGSLIEFGPGAKRFGAAYQRHNLAVAAAAAFVCGLDASAIRCGVSRTRWPGRAELLNYELFGRGGAVLFDVAHNPAGLSALLEHLESDYSAVSSFVFVIGILARKDWHGMLGLLREWEGRNGKVIRVVFTRPNDPHAVSPAELCSVYGGGEIESDPARALERAGQLAFERDEVGESMVVVTGSLFLVAELRPIVASEPFRTIAEDIDTTALV